MDGASSLEFVQTFDLSNVDPTDNNPNWMVGMGGGKTRQFGAPWWCTISAPQLFTVPGSEVD